MFTMSPFSTITIGEYLCSDKPLHLAPSLIWFFPEDMKFHCPKSSPTSLSLNPKVLSQSSLQVGQSPLLQSPPISRPVLPCMPFPSFLRVQTRLHTVLNFYMLISQGRIFDVHGSSSSKISIHKCTDYSQYSVFILDLPNVSTWKPNGYAKKTDLR